MSNVMNEIELIEYTQWLLNRLGMPIEGNENIYVSEYLKQQNKTIQVEYVFQSSMNFELLD